MVLLGIISALLLTVTHPHEAITKRRVKGEQSRGQKNPATTFVPNWDPRF